MTLRTIALELELDHGRTGFAPGERLGGVASWSAAEPPREIALQLSWQCQSLAGRDLKIVQTVVLPEPLASERRPFVLALPDGPYSFEGKLLTLTWTLELVAQPGDDKIRVAITIAPGRRPLVIAPQQQPD